ncbi:MAG: hypothetical protein MJD61_06210 [Proteobacteria bacterium]|nr:hypothetical protein [Pseudomonadota bacterium]
MTSPRVLARQECARPPKQARTLGRRTPDSARPANTRNYQTADASQDRVQAEA